VAARLLKNSIGNDNEDNSVKKKTTEKYIEYI